jgi:hypothetical protein
MEHAKLDNGKQLRKKIETISENYGFWRITANVSRATNNEIIEQVPNC